MRVIDSFDRLRHDSIIGGDDQHDNIGGLRASRTHSGKCFVAGRIEEHNLAAVGRRLFVRDAHLVSANVLRNTAGFAFGDAGRANRVEQCRLTVVHVAHDRNHRRTRHGFRRAFFSSST